MRVAAPLVPVVVKVWKLIVGVPVMDAYGIEQLLPSVHTCPATVTELFANAPFGIAEAATAKLGVEVAFVTVGTNQAGQFAWCRKRCQRSAAASDLPAAGSA